MVIARKVLLDLSVRREIPVPRVQQLVLQEHQDPQGPLESRGLLVPLGSRANLLQSPVLQVPLALRDLTVPMEALVHREVQVILDPVVRLVELVFQVLQDPQVEVVAVEM